MERSAARRCAARTRSSRCTTASPRDWNPARRCFDQIPLSLWERARGERAHTSKRRRRWWARPHPSPLPKGEGVCSLAAIFVLFVVLGALLFAGGGVFIELARIGREHHLLRLAVLLPVDLVQHHRLLFDGER